MHNWVTAAAAKGTTRNKHDFDRVDGGRDGLSYYIIYITVTAHTLAGCNEQWTVELLQQQLLKAQMHNIHHCNCSHPGKLQRTMDSGAAAAATAKSADA